MNIYKIIKWIADNVQSKIEKKFKVEIKDIPDGREFDKYFLSVMNKSKGIHKLSDRDKKIMRLLAEQDEFERFREAIKYY